MLTTRAREISTPPSGVLRRVVQLAVRGVTGARVVPCLASFPARSRPTVSSMTTHERRLELLEHRCPGRTHDARADQDNVGRGGEWSGASGSPVPPAQAWVDLATNGTLMPGGEIHIGAAPRIVIDQSPSYGRLPVVSSANSMSPGRIREVLTLARCEFERSAQCDDELPGPARPCQANVPPTLSPERDAGGGGPCRSADRRVRRQQGRSILPRSMRAAIVARPYPHTPNYAASLCCRIVVAGTRYSPIPAGFAIASSLIRPEERANL